MVACSESRGAVDAPEGVPSSTAVGVGAPTASVGLAFSLANAGDYLAIPTYDGSGQVVHPDIVYFSQGWRGHRYWMAMTPYPSDTDSYENPSILVSEDGLSWAAPDGVTNPLVARPGCDHNSDPDLVYNPTTDELLLYYTEQQRAEYCADSNVNRVLLLRSSDGVNWTKPEVVLEWDLSTEPLYLSPSVVLHGGTFEMWLASSDGVVRATSDDGVRWSTAEKVNMEIVPWHLDVAWVELEAAYWALLVESPAAGSRLRLATSGDGKDWTVQPEPVLSPGAAWDAERIYRSTFVVDGDSLRVWYSARSNDYQWHVGYAEGRR